MLQEFIYSNNKVDLPISLANITTKSFRRINTIVWYFLNNNKVGKNLIAQGGGPL